MSRFDDIDVTDHNISFMDHLPRDYVLKRLLAVHEQKPFGLRRLITAATATPPLLTTSTHMILIPTFDEDETPWKRAHGSELPVWSPGQARPTLVAWLRYDIHFSCSHLET
jgi:hypothetical protein